MSASDDPLARTTLAREIARRLEQRIMDGNLRPGERVNECHLAKELGTSRAPVREACRLLEHKGLLRSQTNHGCFVSAPSAEEVAELLDIWAELEALAGRKAALRATTADYTRLQALIAQMEQLRKADDVVGYMQINLDFHHAILEAARSPQLTGVYEDVVRKLELARFGRIAAPAGMSRSIAGHRAILKALRARDAEGAAAQVRAHVSSGLDRPSVSSAPSVPQAGDEA